MWHTGTIIGLVLLPLIGFGCTSGCQSGQDHSPATDISRRAYYYSRADLKFGPARVFDEIPASEIPTYPGSYFEALYDKQGRLIKLKHLQKDHQHWLVEYTYHSNERINTELWREGDVAYTTWYSPKGQVLKKERHPE